MQKRYPSISDPLSSHIDIVKASDNMTFNGAQRLARTITRYWFDRGFFGVKVWVAESTKLSDLSGRDGSASHRYVVKSNMLDGLPPQDARLRVA